MDNDLQLLWNENAGKVCTWAQDRGRVPSLRCTLCLHLVAKRSTGSEQLASWFLRSQAQPIASEECELWRRQRSLFAEKLAVHLRSHQALPGTEVPGGPGARGRPWRPPERCPDGHGRLRRRSPGREGGQDTTVRRRGPGKRGGGLNGLAWEFMGRATLHLCTVRVPMHTVE